MGEGAAQQSVNGRDVAGRLGRRGPLCGFGQLKHSAEPRVGRGLRQPLPDFLEHFFEGQYLPPRACRKRSLSSYKLIFEGFFSAVTAMQYVKVRVPVAFSIAFKNASDHFGSHNSRKAFQASRPDLFLPSSISSSLEIGSNPACQDLQLTTTTLSRSLFNGCTPTTSTSLGTESCLPE